MGARRAGGVVLSWISVRTGVLAHRASVRDLEREDRKTMEDQRPPIRGHNQNKTRRTGGGYQALDPTENGIYRYVGGVRGG